MTKQELKKIIKEELKVVIKEAYRQDFKKGQLVKTTDGFKGKIKKVEREFGRFGPENIYYVGNLKEPYGEDEIELAESVTNETKAQGYDDPAYRATVKQFKGKKVSKKEFAQALAMHHQSMDESSLGGQIAGDSAETLKDELKQYVKGIIKQPNDRVTYLHSKSVSDAKKVVTLLKKIYGIKSKVDTHTFSPSPTVKFDSDQMLEYYNNNVRDKYIESVNEASDQGKVFVSDQGVKLASSTYKTIDEWLSKMGTPYIRNNKSSYDKIFQTANYFAATSKMMTNHLKRINKELKKEIGPR